MSEYQICKKCVVDNLSYKNVKFDVNGTCNFCNNFKAKIKPILEWNYTNHQKLKKELINKIYKLKKNNKSKYDCLIGVSGGVDSSYLVYHAVINLKLNPLLYHVDTGWNNSIATNNISRIVDYFKLDLHTEVIDWNEIKDLCRSFLLAQVPYMESIQDHAIWAGMHKHAKNNNIKAILTGGNLQTESYRPPLYIAYFSGDLTLIKDIQKKFGKIKLKKFPTLDILVYKIIYKYFYNINLFQPLNFVNYNKEQSKELLINEIGWKNYGDKHHESNFTRFFDGYWKPKKFSHDARKGQLSSLISTNQLTREDALKQLKTSFYSDQNNVNKDLNYIANKLDFKVDELKLMLNTDNKYFYDYRSKYKLLKIVTYFLKLVKIETRDIV